jgi:hypothetical protein
MIIRTAAVPAAFLGLLLVSAQASADCGAARTTFKPGEVMCLSHRAFRCDPMGGWTHLPERCDADNVNRRKPMPADPVAPAAAKPSGATKKDDAPAAPAKAGTDRAA